MTRFAIPLSRGPMGGHREVTGWRFGPPGARPRVHIQGGLHADEAPGMLVGFGLRDRLAALERQGALHGEITLVPVANPIGLDQGVVGASFGRFEATSGQNFNRNFPNAAALALALDDRPPADAPVDDLRRRMIAALDGLRPVTPLAALQTALLRLAIDADIVIDMHCDSEAVTHLYCHSDQAPQAVALGRALGAEAVLHATLQGGQSFDEACTQPWAAFRARWPEADLPLACLAVTLEWRGMLDTDPAVAAEDAEALIAWLAAHGVVDSKADRPRNGTVNATPLAGVEVVNAPEPGLFLADVMPGARVVAGQLLGHLCTLPEGDAIELRAGIDGILYAREQARIVRAGAELFFIAGDRPIREGMLLSA